MNKKEGELFSELISIIAHLRGPRGCLWDREQTLSSMVPNIIEEAQEIKEAVQAEDYPNLCEELGDLLMDILMEIQIAREAGLFDYQQVLNGTRDKFVRRHPHVFGDVKANTPEEALLVWKRMKKEEKEKNGNNGKI